VNKKIQADEMKILDRTC